MSASRTQAVVASKSLVARRRAFRQAFDRLEDRRLMATFTVITNSNTGAGSLRDAVVNANLSPGTDIIAFNLPAGSRTITLTTPLPPLSGPTTIDGTTNPGYAGTPVVEITGGGVLTANGLELAGGNSVVRGLAITGFAKDASNNFGRGVLLGGENNVVEKSYLGLKPDGVTTLALGRAGVEIKSANNTIRDNAIGLTQFGAFIASQTAGANNNVIAGNRIGTNASGSTYVGSTTLVYGTYIGNGANNRVGGSNAADGNVIAIGSSGGVIVVDNAVSTVVDGNLIGLNSGGTGAIVAAGASNDGVIVSNNTGGLTIRDNRIANAPDVQVAIASSTNVLVAGNRIGLNALDAPTGAGTAGVSITGAVSTSNRIGTAAVADRNWITNGSVAGIYTGESGSTYIQNNVIGISPTGTLSTAGHGISAQAGGSDYRIGGLSAGEGNIIYSPAGFSAIIADTMAGSSQPGSTTIAGNQIGMNLAGTAAAGTFAINRNGINLSNTNNALVKGNKIANVGTAIRNSGANYIQGNQIGLDASGLNPLAVTNGIYSVGGIVGGAAAGEGNLVGDWTIDGVIVDDAGATVRGNRIGTNADGSGSYAGQHGIRAFASSTIGGINAGEGNLVTGATGNAIVIDGGSFTVQGNTLGQPGRPNGTGMAVNGTFGSVSNTLIGGDTAAAANVITNNTGKAIAMTQSGANTINNVTVKRNVIHSNGGMAIDLGNDGVTANDALDADTGANGLQNSPFLLSADSSSGTQTVVSGFMNTSGSTPIVIDFYSADASNNETRTWLGSKTIFTDVAGGATYSHTLPFVAGNKYVVATATNILPAPNGTTSELSAGVQVVGPVDTTSPSVASSSFEFESGHAVKLVFSEDMNASSLQATDLTMTNTTTNQSVVPSSANYNAATKTATFAFATPLADGNYAFALNAGAATDLAGNGNVAHANNTFVLAGDANRDRAVNFSDLLILAANYNTNGRTFSQGNFNYDGGGNVGFDDLLILASKYNSSLAGTPAPLVAPGNVDGNDDAGSVGDDVLA